VPILILNQIYKLPIHFYDLNNNRTQIYNFAFSIMDLSTVSLRLVDMVGVFKTERHLLNGRCKRLGLLMVGMS